MASLPDDSSSALARQYEHQVALDRARLRAWAWIPWLFVAGLVFSVLGLIPFVARLREDGSVSFMLFVFAFFTFMFGLAVALWLWPSRPRPRIIPCFAQQLGQFEGAPFAAFKRGYGLYREMVALDALARELNVRPLSDFGFADDYYEQEVRWHPPQDGLKTAEALRLGLDARLLADPALPGDLEVLASALRVAADRGVDWSLALRLRPDSLQVVSTREMRQGRFW